MDQQEETKVIALQDLRKVMKQSKNHVIQGIVHARDKDGLTFREISEATGIAHSWVFKLYKRGKILGY